MKARLATVTNSMVNAAVTTTTLRLSLESPGMNRASEPTLDSKSNPSSDSLPTIGSSQKTPAHQKLKPLRSALPPERCVFPETTPLDCGRKSDDFEYRYFFQPYRPKDKIPSCPLNTKHLEENFQINTEAAAVLVYLPICLGDEIYSDPAQFEDYLQSIVAIFNPRPVHIALTLPDELNRHHLYKEQYMLDPLFFGSKRKNSRPELDESDDCRAEARQQGDNWLKANSIITLASRLGCKITLFRWGELVTLNMTSSSLKNIFIQKMKIESKTNQMDFDVNISELIDHVRDQYNSGIGFATAVRPKLNEVSNKDLSRFSEKTNVDVSDRSNKKYLFEEVAHTMQVFATGLFDVTFQAQIFHRRKFTHKQGTSLFGELLYHWTCEMLFTYLATQKNNSQASQKSATLIMPHYITIGRYPPLTPKNLIVKKTKNTQAEPTESKVFDISSLHQLVVDAVQHRGEKTLTHSEEVIYLQSLSFLNRKNLDLDIARKDNIPESNDDKDYVLGSTDL